MDANGNLKQEHFQSLDVHRREVEEDGAEKPRDGEFGTRDILTIRISPPNYPNRIHAGESRSASVWVRWSIRRADLVGMLY